MDFTDVVVLHLRHNLQIKSKVKGKKEKPNFLYFSFFLFPLSCPCVVRLWAKHSQIKGILKLIDGCGNAMPLRDLSIVTLLLVRYAPLT